MRPLGGAIAAMLLGLTLPAGVAWAEDGFRCPVTGRLVQVGDSALMVERRCGTPAVREPFVEEYCDQGQCGRREGERWIYDFGRNYFVRYLLFFNGTLTRIEDGEYGEQ